MKIKKHKNLKEAIGAVTKKDKEYIFVRHYLKSGEKIRLHYHKKANEFVAIDNGKFKIRLADKEKIFNLKNQAISTYFPKKERHALLAITSISYFVFRDTKDASIFV